jgi:prevent-host-death family protein
METVNVAEAKARLCEILAKVEDGGEVVITRRGHPIARLSPVERPKTPIDFAALDSLRARQPLSRVSSVHLIRKMRDSRCG